MKTVYKVVAEVKAVDAHNENEPVNTVSLPPPLELGSFNSLIELQGFMSELNRDAASKEEISEAIATYECDEIEIDARADRSEAEGGVWIQAWVWLNR